MARWKLATAHYLQTEGIEWEYQEVDRITGRPVRKKFQVPRFLDPRDPADWNHRWGRADDLQGEIIVCQGGGEPADIEFIGDPTPDMIPIDEAAKEISARHATRWNFRPEESDNPNAFSQSLVDKFQSEMSDVLARPVQVPGLQELTTAIGAMAQTNQQLIEAVAKRRL